MYRPNVADIRHALNDIAGLAPALAAGRFGDLSADLVDAVLEEASRFTAERIAPMRMVGDKNPARAKDGEVTTTPGWAQMYQAWVEGGWNSVAAPEEFGGQGLPTMISIALNEMWNAGSMSFGLCPMLSMGAIEALDKHGSDYLKHTYLPKLVEGAWTGTMNLTEPQAGSDLAALRTRAERNGDGTYSIFGQKIYITYGEHDIADNICHLVLARLPDAPAGTRGISLFLVPKFRVNDDGSLGARNDVYCHAVEHKLGIHGSPTCTMIYGDGKWGNAPGAIGWLVGEENRGLACMFTMMNNARLAVGAQGVAIADAAYQHALAYAQERRQGKAPGASGDNMSPIIEHADIQRELLTMKALTQSARALCYATAYAIDMARTSEGDESRHWNERAGLLTPLAKAYGTDVGCEVASRGVQIHGGMGYVEETGAAVLLRDARIAPIYEGTNGIQAIDLVQRKLPLSGGAAIAGLLDELAATIDTVCASNQPGMTETATQLARALADTRTATAFLMERLAAGDVPTALAGATPYLRLLSETAGGVMIAGGAVATGEAARLALARFLATNLIGDTPGLRDTVTAGADALAAARTALVA
ncbi:MAG: acyl-CoA dehydrogenase [Phyllobacteriaceae bacterium]|nr:acyl-CoA dehydrogenase [Phyllobacteriaceae bacterium]